MFSQLHYAMTRALRKLVSAFQLLRRPEPFALIDPASNFWELKCAHIG